jgi:hypothetical protein
VACRIVRGKGIGTELPIYENRGVRNEKGYLMAGRKIFS